MESLIVRGIDGEGDGIVLNTGLSLFAQPGTLRNQFDKLAGNGNLAFGLLAETDADGVADTLGEQGTDAYGRLDAPVFALASLGDTQVEGIVHILTVHRLDQQTHGGDHHHRVGGLDTDDDIVELLATADAQKLHTTLDDTLRGITVARHDTVGE